MHSAAENARHATTTLARTKRKINIGRNATAYGGRLHFISLGAGIRIAIMLLIVQPSWRMTSCVPTLQQLIAMRIAGQATRIQSQTESSVAKPAKKEAVLPNLLGKPTGRPRARKKKELALALVIVSVVVIVIATVVIVIVVTAIVIVVVIVIVIRIVIVLSSSLSSCSPSYRHRYSYSLMSSFYRYRYRHCHRSYVIILSLSLSV